jgi:type III restriction enzyme
MNRVVNTIAGRLSLRAPQRRSLEILDRICEIADPKKGADAQAILKVIQSEFPTVKDFEREFPSLCFALATGVGKTRLMGAFVAYMYLTGRSRHFFVLAPNLTIYNKLIADFTPGTPKYVFQGVTEFVTAPPVVITGDNYEQGIGVRADVRKGQLGLLRAGGEDAVHINVFNISKFNKDVKDGKDTKGVPRMRRLAEYIGESYFDYLSNLPDLVVMMDEAHRYRADAGTKAINELRPILGMELTATPFTESSKGPVPFKNAIYSYSLAEAITDGFVKNPAVATRKDFDATKLDKAKLERIKLEDGVRLHEQVKTDLKVFAAESDKALVKPFILVIAEDTEHAGRLVELIESDTFFDGNYKDRVIEVHSALKGEEKEETIQRLLAVEDPAEKTEIVVHVNMLKEGWDVTNLYTIVPLRAANARTLIEQSIGRGLRLPFGKKTGVKAVDRLTIVAHDNFQAIVDEANRGDSIIRRIDTIILDPGGAEDAPKPVEVKPIIEQILGGEEAPPTPSLGPTPAGEAAPVVTSTPPAGALPTFTTPTEKAVAKATLAVIAQKASLPSAASILEPEQQKKIVQAVLAIVPHQQDLPGLSDEVEAVVKKASEVYVALSIDIPAITVVPTGEVTITFDDFDLDLTAFPHLQAVERDILIQHLQSSEQEQLSVVGGGIYEARLEDYIVSALIGYDDVDYDATSELLYKLATQVVTYLQGYLATDDHVRNVLVYYQSRLGALVHAQMERHRHERVTGYEVKVLAGHRPLKPVVIQERPDEPRRNFRAPVDDKRRIPQMVFGGFSKCLYPLQKFGSDPERRLAVLLENDKEVTKWVKPGAKDFPILLKSGRNYEPDFLVEATHGKYICEVKRADFVQEEDVLAKADAATVWCRHATEHASPDGRPWRYVLLPDNVIVESRSLKVLADEYEHRTTVPAVVTGRVENDGAKVLPFRRVTGAEVRPFENCVPIYSDLRIAAGRFREQEVEGVPQVGEVEHPENHEWVALEGKTKPAQGLFVAQVAGESMNKRIPNGAWCLWKLDPGCDGRSGAEVVLAHRHDLRDSDFGPGYTVKLYKALREELDDGTWRIAKVILKPDSDDASYQPIVLDRLVEGELVIVAEMVEVLG